MVQVSVGDDHGVDRAERGDLRGVQIRRAVVFRDQDAAVDEDLRFARAQQRRGPSDLTESAEGGDPNVILTRRHLARKSPADLLQERLTFVVNRSEILANLLHGLRGNRRRPDDFWGPPDLLLDLIEDRTVAAYDHARGESLDRHLARLRLEIDPGDLRFRWDHLTDDFLGLLGCREQGRIGPYDDPAPQLLGNLSHEVVRLCEDLHVLRVDHDRGAFEVDLRDFHVVRDHFLHDASRVVQNVLDGHRTSLWPEVATDSGQFHTRFALLDFFVVEHLEAVFRNEGHIDPFAGDRVALHGGGHGPDREVRSLFERHVVLPVVFEDPVHVRAPGAAGHELVGQGPAGRVERVDVASRAVPAANHELDPGRIESGPAQDVRGEGRAGLDRHRDAALQLVQLDLLSNVSSEDLQVSDESGRREPEVLVESVHLLRSLVGNQGPGGRPAIGREDDSVLADQAQRGRAGLNFPGNR